MCIYVYTYFYTLHRHIYMYIYTHIFLYDTYMHINVHIFYLYTLIILSKSIHKSLSISFSLWDFAASKRGVHRSPLLYRNEKMSVFQQGVKGDYQINYFFLSFFFFLWKRLHSEAKCIIYTYKRPLCYASQFFSVSFLNNEVMKGVKRALNLSRRSSWITAASRQLQ